MTPTQFETLITLLAGVFGTLQLLLGAVILLGATINRNLRRLLAMSMKIADLIELVRTATDNLATRVSALMDSIKNNANEGVLTQAQEREANEIIAQLNAIGSDPSNPVPESDAGTETV